MIKLPDGSLYLWMYTQGLIGTDLQDIVESCNIQNRILRDKDVENYWNGIHRRYNTSKESPFKKSLASFSGLGYFESGLGDYPENPNYFIPDMKERWIPCNAQNKPMIKWGNGCYSYTDAVCWPGAKYIGENLKGGKIIVVDCDGDHDPEHLDTETIEFLWKFSEITHTLCKPKSCIDVDSNLLGTSIEDAPTSFHLTFTTDRIIPTMHFPKVHIDILGNKENQIRYLKNKIWNKKEPAELTDEIWDQLKEFIRKGIE